MTYTLGRHVNHDPRSLSYAYPALTPAANVRWTRKAPVFDQGDLGSCTGNAAVGCIATEPYFDTLPQGTQLDEARAVSVYSAATTIDTYPGSYPPTDTGSDGLSVAKVLKGLGLISGYQHVLSFDALLSALAGGPVIAGTNWYQGMFTPDQDNVISIADGDSVAGGHEYVLDEVDLDKGLIGITNSWGTSWGAGGRAYLAFDTVRRLLAEQGDVTVFTPLTLPAPVPVPVPPSPVVDTLDEHLWASLQHWADAKHWGSNHSAAALVRAWAKAKGYTL